MEFRGKKLEKTSFFPQVCLLPHWQVVKCASGHVERFLQSGKNILLPSLANKQLIDRSNESFVTFITNKRKHERSSRTNESAKEHTNATNKRTKEWWKKEPECRHEKEKQCRTFTWKSSAFRYTSSLDGSTPSGGGFCFSSARVYSVL